jgi:hypothetical protein
MEISYVEEKKASDDRKAREEVCVGPRIACDDTLGCLKSSLVRKTQIIAPPKNLGCVSAFENGPKTFGVLILRNFAASYEISQQNAAPILKIAFLCGFESPSSTFPIISFIGAFLTGTDYYYFSSQK